MAKQYRVKIRNSIFPVRINGKRYRNGQEALVSENDYFEARMELLEEVSEDKPKKKKVNESE
jgi:hypothetical protein